VTPVDAYPIEAFYPLRKRAVRVRSGGTKWTGKNILIRGFGKPAWWRIGVHPSAGRHRCLMRCSQTGEKRLSGDVEGLLAASDLQNSQKNSALRPKASEPIQVSVAGTWRAWSKLI